MIWVLIAGYCFIALVAVALIVRYDQYAPTEGLMAIGLLWPVFLFVMIVAATAEGIGRVIDWCAGKK